MIAVILWLETGNITVAKMPQWLIKSEPDACNLWVNHVLNMAWSLWAFCM